MLGIFRIFYNEQKTRLRYLVSILSGRTNVRSC
jgi:hypothetical protein